MTQTVSTYERQAQDFLKATGATMTAEFIAHRKHFEDDETTRDVYKITLTRGRRSFSFEFGQSVNASGKWQISGPTEAVTRNARHRFGGYAIHTEKERTVAQVGALSGMGNVIKRNENFSAPSAYDVLAALTKNDPGTFENFCAEYGYGDQKLSDYPKVKRIYEAVVNDWQNVQALFNDEELEQLQEIQ